MKLAVTELILSNQKNEVVFSYLNASEKTVVSYEEGKSQHLNVKTHPDVVASFISILPNDISASGVYLLDGNLISINLQNGLIIALAIGTYPFIIRLNKKFEQKYLSLGLKTELEDQDGVYTSNKELTDDWFFCFSFNNNIKAIFKEAYRLSMSN